jgi:lipoprotein-anchoring transpeptidase ErfK/SrfK
VRQTKYKLPASRKQKGGAFYWLLALALAVLLGWLWWKTGKISSHQTKPKVVAIAKQLATNTWRRIPAATVSTNLPASAPSSSSGFPRAVQNVFEAQLALIQQGISPGSLDGSAGSQTRAAIAAFQKNEGLPITGALDAATKSKLVLEDSPLVTYIVTSNDLARLQPIAPTWLGKSEQSALDFENILELVAEKTFAHPNFIRRLNPEINWSNVVAGTSLQVPNTSYPDEPAKAAWVTIHLNSKILEAFDADTNLIAHFPCSIAKRVEKRPVGLLHVVVVAPHPNYTFDPEVFPESAEAKQLQRKLVLPPGPNNPVGIAWIGLDRPGYGIHGTPRPEDVGRTESHGCFRLANWNAEYLLHVISIGTPVYVVE